MEERVQISMLIDFYGELLTEKQKYIMNMYYNEDFSLAEIAEINHTSRQAIHDNIKRCHKLLLDYEDKLKLMEISAKISNWKVSILNQLDLLLEVEDEAKKNALIDKIKKEIETI